MKYVEGTTTCSSTEMWVCQACGKTARSRYGFDKDNKSTQVNGAAWDESCMLNAVLCKYPPKNNQWEAA